MPCRFVYVDEKLRTSYEEIDEQRYAMGSEKAPPPINSSLISTPSAQLWVGLLQVGHDLEKSFLIGIGGGQADIDPADT